MVDQNSAVTLTKLSREAQDLHQLYESYVMEQDGLHLRPVDIPNEELFYELSVDFDLLDDLTQDQLSTYIKNIRISQPSTSTNDLVSEYRVIPQEYLPEIKEKLGIRAVIDNKMQDIFDKFLNIYTELLEALSRVFEDGVSCDVYYGTKYYPKKLDAQVAFAMDEDGSSIYMMDYSEDEDVPAITEIGWHKAVARAINIVCFSQDLVSFYSMY